MYLELLRAAGTSGTGQRYSIFLVSVAGQAICTIQLRGFARGALSQVPTMMRDLGLGSRDNTVVKTIVADASHAKSLSLWLPLLPQSVAFPTYSQNSCLLLLK